MIVEYFFKLIGYCRMKIREAIFIIKFKNSIKFGWISESSNDEQFNLDSLVEQVANSVKAIAPS